MSHIFTWCLSWCLKKSKSYVPTSLPRRSHLNRLLQDFSPKDASMILQFRTGHVNIPSYKLRINSHMLHRCTCGHIESTFHILLFCWIYDDLRKELRANIQRSVGKFKWSPKILLDCPLTIHHTVHYLKKCLKRRLTLTHISSPVTIPCHPRSTP
jgi:hypothetical protein